MSRRTERLSLSLSLSLPDLDIEGTSFEKMGTAIDTTMDGCCCSRLTTSVHALEVHFHEHARMMHTGTCIWPTCPSHDVHLLHSANHASLAGTMVGNRRDNSHSFTMYYKYALVLGVGGQSEVAKEAKFGPPRSKGQHHPLPCLLTCGPQVPSPYFSRHNLPGLLNMRTITSSTVFTIIPR